jgi:hypothetical protein
LTQFVSPDDEHDVLETCRELKIKINTQKGICASRWSFTKKHYMMHGQQNVKFSRLELHDSPSTFDTCSVSVRSLTQLQGNRRSPFSFSIVTVKLGTTLTRSWTFRKSNPRWGEIFLTRLDQTWGPHSFLYNRYRVIPGAKATGALR